MEDLAISLTEDSFGYSPQLGGCVTVELGAYVALQPLGCHLTGVFTRLYIDL
jgi:hypothetical protein